MAGASGSASDRINAWRKRCCSKRQVEIAEGKYLDKRQVPRCTFNELAALYLPWAQTNHRSYVATKSRVTLLCQAFGDRQLSEITPLIVDGYISQRAAIVKPATVNRDVVVLRHMFVKAMAWGKALDESRGARQAITGEQSTAAVFVP